MSKQHPSSRLSPGRRAGRGLVPLAWLVAWSCGSGWAFADTQIQASASYRLDGGDTVLLSAPLSGTQSAGAVDVLETGEAQQGYSAYNIRTGGSASGQFGSQSGGQGHYDVTGRFAITRTVTNDTGSAQEARFNFFIHPGLLNNEIRSDLSAPGSFVDAGIQFGVQRDGVQVWGSQAQLRTDAAGTVFNHSGANLYTVAGPSTYTIQGGARSVSLGVLGAGESITVQYELSTFARGLAAAPLDTFIAPSFSVVIPEQTVFYPEASVLFQVSDSANHVGSVNEPLPPGVFPNVRWEIRTRPAYSEVIPAQTITVAEYVSFQPSGSHARSGDPFEIDAASGRTRSLFASLTEEPLPSVPSTFSVILTPVPEPSTWLLVFSGLMTVGALGARRQVKAVSAG